MIKIENNFGRISSSEHKLINTLTQYLVIVDKSDRDNPKVLPLYEIDTNGDLLIPIGLLKFIPESVSRINVANQDIPNEFNIDYDEIAHSFGDIVLRDDQLVAIRKMLLIRRGIMQLATGSGKTEIMAGFLMGLNKICGYIPDTMILEPTLLLVRSTVKRLKKYGINAKAYSSNRGKLSGVIVTHPASLNNDLDKNPKLLETLKVFLSDEGHHLQADTWNHLINSCSNIEFSIAMSASVINPNRLPIKELGRLDYHEALVLGATGDVIMNVPPSFYIQKGILANPILFRLANPADEYCKKNYDWHQIRKNRLESEYRTQLVAKCSAFFASQGYKSLILVGTKEHAYRILKLIHEYGLGNLCRCSFGGGSYYKWDSDKSEASICKDENTMEGFESGLFKIFIGTSHIYEGADIPNLDAVVLSNAGKTLRKVIQGIGRAIRKTKTGKYAYIIDFTDHFDKILSSHSRSRREMCTSIIGVEPNHIYDSCSFETFKQKFCELEEIHQ